VAALIAGTAVVIGVLPQMWALAWMRRAIEAPEVSRASTVEPAALAVAAAAFLLCLAGGGLLAVAHFRHQTRRRS
jgi:hypothetical protein